jgi:glycogen operon protein
MIEFMRKGIERIRRHPILSRRRFLLGKDRDRDRIPDISWFGPDGAQPAWNDPECRTLCCRLDSSEIKSQEDSDDLFLIFNAHPQNQMIKLPAPVEGASWHRVLDTSLPSPEDLLELGAEVRVEPGGQYLASARSTVLLIAKPAPVTEAPENPPT